MHNFAAPRKPAYFIKKVAVGRYRSSLYPIIHGCTKIRRVLRVWKQAENFFSVVPYSCLKLTTVILCPNSQMLYSIGLSDQFIENENCVSRGRQKVGSLN